MLRVMVRPPLDLTDDELREKIRSAEHVDYFVSDWLRELDRREAKRHADAQDRIARLATAAAVVSAVSAGVALAALLVSRS